MQRSMQYHAESLTDSKTYIKNKEDQSNENRQKISRTRQGLIQIWPVSKDSSNSKINLDERGRFRNE